MVLKLGAIYHMLTPTRPFVYFGIIIQIWVRLGVGSIPLLEIRVIINLALWVHEGLHVSGCKKESM